MKGESNESDILIEGSIMGLGRNLMLGKFPGIRFPQLRLIAIVHRAFCFNQISDYLNCHHRTYIK